jgi:hypothetical protein
VAERTASACFLVTPVFSDTLSTNSPLFMGVSVRTIEQDYTNTERHQY